jgi:hypothetical protein
LIVTFFRISELSTITKSDLIFDLPLIDADDVVLVMFSLLLPLRSLRVRVVNGETISRNLDVSTSIFMAERAACERLADLPIYKSNVVRDTDNEVRTNGHTVSTLLYGFESFLWHPILVIQGIGGKTPDISIRGNHPANQLLDGAGHLVTADPFTTDLTELSFPMITGNQICLTVRVQYFSKSSLVENCSPSTYSNGVRPMRISKKVIPRDQTSDFRVSW